MLKRIFILILALCCAFSFISQPVSAASTGVVLTAAMIGMAVAGAFGLYFASEAGYVAFGNNLHSGVISVPDGPSWWERASMGLIQLANLPTNLKKAIWSQAEQAADSTLQSGQDSSTYSFSLSSYITYEDGSPISVYDFRPITIDFISPYSYPIYCIEGGYFIRNGSEFVPIIGFYSAKPFKTAGGSSAKVRSDGFYQWMEQEGKSFNVSRYRFENFNLSFNSSDEFDSYVCSLLSLYSVSSAGGATAAYPTYGYDGVNLPNIDLTQPGLVGADGNSTVADLIGQLQSGAITWEDYIGTVAPGQTATITITDENGAAVTYTLTNTGVGTRVEPGTDVTEGTEPVVVPAPSELTGTLADTDAKSFLGSLAETIAKPFADVIEKVQAIPAAISEALATTFKPVADLGHFALDLSKYFPFCIPFDLYDFLMCLNAAPEAPVIDWEIPLPGGKTYPMEIDLSPFDPVAQLLRRLELLLFCVGLAFKTRDLIKG